MAEAYDHLAEWFEILNDDCDYPSWSQYFIRGLKALGAGECGLEVGCGSGYFSRALAREGYRMTGSDLSEAMLARAARYAAEEGVRVEWVRADARKLSVPKKYDFLLSANDCYNYLSGEELPAAFRRAAGALKKGGIFWFDLSSAHKLRDKVANNMFADDRDDVSCYYFNRLERDRVTTDVTLYVRGADGRFDRYDERHVLYIHEEEAAVLALEGAGFSVLRAEGALGEEKEGSDRLNLICRKVGA